mgnify:CR=1 FL=1
MKCPACPLIVQSYSMAEHYRTKHANVVMGTDVKELVRLRAHEKEYTLPLLDKKENRTKLLCSDPNCECKK